METLSTKNGLSIVAVIGWCSLCDELTDLRQQFVGNNRQLVKKLDVVRDLIERDQFDWRLNEILVEGQDESPTRGFSVLLPYRDYVSLFNSFCWLRDESKTNTRLALPI